MKNSPTICFDYDFLLYQAACVVEKRKIKVVNKITSEEHVFKNRTEFYGHWKKKEGGWLAEINKSRTSPYDVEDFLIEDTMDVEPIDNAIHILNNSIKGICSTLDISNYYGYTGKGNTFRHDVATMLPYKGNRENMQKPVYLDDLKDYIVKRHNAEIVRHYEADDYCSMDAYAAYFKFKETGNLADKLITVAVDKDARGTTGFLFNPNDMFEPVEINGVGYLSKEGSKITGIGRAWFYFQVAYGDPSDNYKPSCLSTKDVGEVAAYNAIKDSVTDQDYWKALIVLYKDLYPEPIKVINFRQDEIEVDWKYALQEIVDLAHMKRFKEDKIDLSKVLTWVGENG